MVFCEEFALISSVPSQGVKLAFASWGYCEGPAGNTHASLGFSTTSSAPGTVSGIERMFNKYLLHE